jgi:hypothetical protein
MAYSNRDCFFMGTEERASFFRTPVRGADSSPAAWSDGGTLLNGGGYQFNSWGSHKTYQFEWGSSTPYEYAQKLKSYFDGTYGRGLMYFYDPNTFNHNVLPARWADPSMALDSEGAGLVYGVTPTVATDDFDGSLNGYPIRGASYDLRNTVAGWRGREDALYLPIPDGYTLALGVAGSSTGAARVMYRTSNRGTLSMSVGSLVLMSENGDASEGGYGIDAYGMTPFGAEGSARVVNTYIASSANVSGVWLFVGKTTNGQGTINLHGMTARLLKTELVRGEIGLGYGLDPYGQWPYGNYSPMSGMLSAGPWTGGMGHSGTRFMGPPTFEITGPGLKKQGQAGFAASFREVGSFAYA